MPVRKLTKNAVSSLRPGVTIWDTDVRGFGARRRKGATTFVLKTRARGRQTFLSIGRFGSPWTVEMARKEALRLLGDIASGGDPSASKRHDRRAPTLTEFAERYVSEYAAAHKKARTIEEDVRMLRLHILPALGTLKIGNVTRTDIARFHSGRRHHPTNANRCLALLSHIMTIAERWGERTDGSNPCKHVERYPEGKRERFLTPDELRRLGDTLLSVEKTAHPSAVAAIRLLIFTGGRLSEVLGLKWDWIDFARGIARLPDSKTGAKNLTLPMPALEVLANLPRLANNPFVLPGERRGAQFAGIQKAWQRIRKIAGLSNVRIHDLRHAFASVAVQSDESLYLVGRVLGHQQIATTQRYAHLAPAALRAVADRTAERLSEMMRGLSTQEKK